MSETLNFTSIITGTNRGIGKALLENFASNGFNVFACARKSTLEFENFCAELAEKNKVKIYPVYFDFGDKESVADAAKEILKTKIKIDALVNNAGMLGSPQLFVMTKMEDVKFQFDVNFFNQMLFTQKIVKHMMKNKSGSIVNVASISGLDGYGVQFGYVTGKSALIGATKKLARELAPFNIRVNAVAPGIVDTDMSAQMSEEQQSEVFEKIAMKRKATPEEIANVVKFFVSNESSYITGQILRVDGGM